MNEYKTVKEINDFLKYNVDAYTKTPQRELTKDLTLQDINNLKESRDYLDNIFKKYTQTIRNDTYKGSICPNCNKPKDTYKILCYNCATK